MQKESSFFLQVYEVVKLIPKARVTSYGAIARYLGTGMSSRMVGWAMNHSHGEASAVPAHRVVNRQGLLTGKAHFGPHNEMQRLLEAEGLKVENDKVSNFNDVYWDPAVELAL